jgi:chromosome partitioning protein
VPLSHVIQHTCFTDLDIIPGNLDLMEFEHDTPRAIASQDGTLFFTRVGAALAEVEGDYDIVVIDCPPQLGFLTMSALSAATAVLVTVHPQMLDVMSMCQFLLMTSNLLGVVAEAGGDMSYDWLRYPPDGQLHARDVRRARAQPRGAEIHRDLGRGHHQADAL